MKMKTNKRSSRPLASCTLLLLLLCTNAWSMPIYYESTQVNGNQWRYDYTLGNDTGSDINWFTVFFDPALYSFDVHGSGGLDPADFDAPAGWDPLVGLPILTPVAFAGFYDAFAFGAPLAPGDELGGFSINFNWVGQGTPGAQPFTLAGAGLPSVPDFFTQQRSAVTVPVPATGLLVLLTLFHFIRRTRVVA